MHGWRTQTAQGACFQSSRPQHKDTWKEPSSSVDIQPPYHHGQAAYSVQGHIEVLLRLTACIKSAITMMHIWQTQAPMLVKEHNNASAYLGQLRLQSSSSGLLCLGLLCSHGSLPCLMLPCRGSSRPSPAAAWCLPLDSFQGCRSPSSLLTLGLALLHPGALQQAAHWVKPWNGTCACNMTHLIPRAMTHLVA